MTTVHITVWCAPVGAPYDFSETVDTEMTREMWDLVPGVVREQFAQKKIAELVARMIETGWSEVESDD